MCPAHFAGPLQVTPCRSPPTPPAGPCVVNVYINYEKKFAFVEFRTVEETSNAMALDGIMFEGVSVRVRRPNDYNPAAAATLGPANPNPALNLTAIGLQVGRRPGQWCQDHSPGLIDGAVVTPIDRGDGKGIRSQAWVMLAAQKDFVASRCLLDMPYRRHPCPMC